MKWRWWAASAAGLALGAVGWLLARTRDGSPRSASPSLDPLRRCLEEIAGPDRVRLRDLGGGIVELVGKVEDPDLESRLLEEARDFEGVEVVVDRLWGSGADRAATPNRPIDAPSEPR